MVSKFRNFLQATKFLNFWVAVKDDCPMKLVSERLFVNLLLTFSFFPTFIACFLYTVCWLLSMTYYRHNAKKNHI